jgi:hypothetical protein
MNPAVVSTRLLLILLASAMACPSWLWGDCCCTRRAAAGNARSCCSVSAGSKQASAPKKRSCCAARLGDGAKSQAPSTLAEPASQCRCRTQTVAVPTAKSPWSLDRVSFQRCDWIAVRNHEVVSNDFASRISRGDDHKLGSPLDAHDRCIVLCRWLA